MAAFFETAQYSETGIVTREPLRIYTGVLGQIGDIVMFSATVRRLRELYPRSQITFAVSNRYREAGELVAGLPYIDRLFVTQQYFERMTQQLFLPWHMGWPADLRGDDEVEEQRRHDLVFETRPRHRRMPWWEFEHQVAELAHMVGVPGPIDLRTEIALPPGEVSPEAAGRIVLHNDPSIDTTKSWPWESVRQLIRFVGPGQILLLGNPGPEVPDAVDLRGRTTLAQAAAIIRAARCFVGIDSGLMWVAGSLCVPTVGLYGTAYIPAYEAIQPRNPRATYLQVDGTLDRIPSDRVYAAVCETLRRTTDHPVGQESTVK